MRYKQSILKFASILLILVLTQKMAGGLYLHNWLHGSKSIAQHPAGGQSIGQFNCSCIDDFYVPFTEAPSFLPASPAAIPPVFYAMPAVAIHPVAKFFQSLRGPPVA